MDLGNPVSLNDYYFLSPSQIPIEFGSFVVFQKRILLFLAYSLFFAFDRIEKNWEVVFMDFVLI